jgi:hypothetical protein
MRQLKHSCFISYASGEHELLRRFMRDLTRALESALEPWLPRELTVYRDTSGLRAGNQVEPALARALCQSLCMVLVYTPNYGRREFCLREFAGMRRLQDLRFERMNLPHSDKGLIIPIILRGRREDLPPHLREHIHCLDFSPYTTSNQSILRNWAYMSQIERVAQYIHDLYCMVEGADIIDQMDCEAFELPTGPLDELWRGGRRRPDQGFPY